MCDKNVWWTDKLNTKRNILRNVYKKRHTQRVMEKYKELKRDLSKEIRQAKTKAWRYFCSNAESVKDVSKIVQILENPPSKQMSLLREGDGVLTPKDSIWHLVLTHFPQGRINDQHADDAVSGSPDYTGVVQFITPSKVRAALQSFGDYKSPGPDEFPPIALKKAGQLLLQHHY